MLNQQNKIGLIQIKLRTGPVAGVIAIIESGPPKTRRVPLIYYIPFIDVTIYSFYGYSLQQIADMDIAYKHWGLSHHTQIIIPKIFKLAMVLTK
jgi:hypothetical protein